MSRNRRLPNYSQSLSQSQTQTSQSQRNRSEHIEEIDIDEHVNNMVRYVIHRAGINNVIKQSELKKKTGINANLQVILNRASKILKETYGYNVITDASLPSSQKSYIISNGLEFVEDPRKDADMNIIPDDVQQILTLLILTHIFMSNNEVSEASLFLFLNSLKIDVERNHTLFGNVINSINDLKQKKYLNVETDEISKKVTYSWGSRAEKEISKKEILQFVCKMYNSGKQPTSWTAQHQAAENQDFNNHKESLDGAHNASDL